MSNALAAPTPLSESDTSTKSSGSSTPSRSPLKKAFSSFTKSSGKKVASRMNPSASESSIGARPTAMSAFTQDGQEGDASNVSIGGDDKTQDSMEKKPGEVEEAALQRAMKNPKVKPLPGHPGNLSTSQAEALLKLIFLLKQDGALHDPTKKPPSYQETQLLRFLRARSWDVQAARTMYLKAEAWKKEIQLEKLCQAFIFEEEEAVADCGWRMYFHKTDKLGRPVFIQDLANINTTTLFQVTDPGRIIKNLAVTLELAVRHRYEGCTIHSNRWVDDNMMVVNVAGLGLSTFWAMKGQLQQLLSILDNNFPELSGRVQIINAPYMFSTAWSWIKGWLPVGTVEKIDIAGYDYLPLVLQYVEKEDWPKALGGECCCGGEDKACFRGDQGPWDRNLVKPGRS